MSETLFKANETKRILDFSRDKLPTICVFSAFTLRIVIVSLLAVALVAAFSNVEINWFILFGVTIVLPIVLEFSFTMFSLVTAHLWGKTMVWAWGFFGITTLGAMYNAFQLTKFVEAVGIPDNVFIEITVTLQFSNFIAWALSEAAGLLIVTDGQDITTFAKAAKTEKVMADNNIKVESSQVLKFVNGRDFIDPTFFNLINSASFTKPAMIERSFSDEIIVDGNSYKLDNIRAAIRTNLNRAKKGEGNPDTQFSSIARYLFILDEWDSLKKGESKAVLGILHADNF